MIRTIVAVFAVLVVSVLAVNALLVLLRMSSDIAVLVGVVGLFAVAMLWAFCAKRLWQTGRLLFVFALAATVTGCTTIGPGHAGIVVNMYGDNRGVSNYPVKTGRVWYNPWSEDVFEYPCFLQSDKWIDGDGESGAVVFNDRDGMRVGFGVSFSYMIACDKVPAFYVKFRSDDIDTFTDNYLKNTAQEFLNAEGAKRSSEQLYGVDKEDFLNVVKARLNERLAIIGVVLDQFSIVGEMVLPPQVKAAIEAKLKATQDAQRVENELRSAEAEAKKRVAEATGEANAAIEKARGQAVANQTITASLTSQLLEWRRLTIQENATNRWNGTLPQTMLGDTTPMIQLRQP